jgi:hypothetical protein
MKKIDLLHTTVLIVAILCGYSGILTLLGILNAVIYMSDIFYDKSGTTGAFIVPSIIQAGIYALICIILIKNGKRIANYLVGNERPEFEEFPDETDSGDTHPRPAATTVTEDPDTLEWHLDRRGILFALFIGIGLYTFIQYIPPFLNGLIMEFRGLGSAGAIELIRPAHRDPLLLDGLRITIGALLIYAAPTLTNYIEKTIAARLHSDPQNQ